MADATVEGCGTVSKGGVGDYGDIGKGFSNPFGIPMRRETKDREGEKLEFCGEPIKVFLFVFVDVCKEGVVR